MKKTKTKQKWWKLRGADSPPAEYNECYLRALRRLAVTLNCHAPRSSPFNTASRKKSDLELQDIFRQKKIGSIDANAALVNHELIERHQELEDFDQAENLFYGDFDFSCPRGFKNIVRVTHRSTPAFRKWSFERLLWPTLETPQAEAERLKKRAGETDAEFMMSCASNYLLKNFWHNYVHRQIQDLYSEERHYSHNISTLLYYFLYYLSNYRNDERVKWDFYSRLTLDIEQLLTNTRSFLDSSYRLALLFSDERSRIPGRRQKSFGKFADWDQGNNKPFDLPLSFMSELVPWGLTIRRVRDDYVHRGHEALPFWGSDDVFFYPYLSGQKVSPMPDLFYRSDSALQTAEDSMKPIYLRKFVVYAVAPIFAVEQVLGRYFHDLFSSKYGPSSLDDFACPFKANPSIQALYELVGQNKECLEREIYKKTYFI